MLAAGQTAGCGSGGPAGYGWVGEKAPSTWPRTPRSRGVGNVAHPPAWPAVAGPNGEVNVARLSTDGRVLAYVQISSAPAGTSPAGWLAHRAARERAQGLRELVIEGQSRRLAFPAGAGACVTDSYAAPANRYREIACLVATRPRPTAIVAAAPVAHWAAEARDLERVVSSLHG